MRQRIEIAASGVNQVHLIDRVRLTTRFCGKIIIP